MGCPKTQHKKGWLFKGRKTKNRNKLNFYLNKGGGNGSQEGVFFIFRKNAQKTPKKNAQKKRLKIKKKRKKKNAQKTKKKKRQFSKLTQKNAKKKTPKKSQRKRQILKFLI